MTQHVSGTIVPIFRSTSLYTIWFSALKVLAGVFGRRKAGRVHCVEAVHSAQCKMGTMVPETC